MSGSFQNKREKFVFSMAITFLWGLVAHGYCFFNLNLSHDSLLIFQERDIPAMLSVGRFMHPVMFFLRGNTYTPALVGLLSLIFIGAAVYLTAQLLEVERKGPLCLVSGVMTVNAVAALINASYIHVSDLYALALLLAVVSVVVCRKGRFGFLAAMVPAILSLGLYQSYIQAAIVLHIFLAILGILHGENIGKVFRDGLKAVVSLVAALILYYILYNVLLKVTGTHVSTNYNTLSDAGNFGGIGAICYQAVYAVWYAVRYFLHPAIYHSRLMAGVNILTALLCAFFLVDIVRVKKIRGWALVLLAVLIAVLPFGMNLICFISKGMVHHLMLYSVFFAYILAEKLLEEWLNCGGRERLAKLRADWAKYLIPGLIAVTLYNSVIYSNQLYLKKDLEYDATMMTMNRIVNRIEQTAGYVYGQTPVAIVGLLLDSELTHQAEDFDYSGTGMWHSYSVTFPESYGLFLNNAMGYSINLLPPEESAALADTDAVKAMQNFPAANSVQMLDGVIVVKLSEIVEHPA